MKEAGVHIAGLGMISAIGNNVYEALSAFERGEAGMGDVAYLDTVHRLPVAEVKADNGELGNMAGIGRTLFGEQVASRTALLSLIAARDALSDAAIPGLSDLRTGFVSANTVGGMDRTELFFEDFLNGGGRLRDVVLHECGHITEWVADRLGITHYQTTISTACSSSANAILFGARLIRHGMLDVVVAGGVDALTRFTLNGFNSLMILDKEPCRPFDDTRSGLNLGEGAGYVVLVSDKVAVTLSGPASLRGPAVLAPSIVLSGFANANDAYHQTASSPDGRGSFLAMQGALRRSGLKPADIDYINLHGTGTQNNDLAEGTAIKRIFDPAYPPMSSTKSFTGHTLGASGGIEAVLSVMAIRYGLIYPNLRFSTPMTELSLTPAATFLKGVSVNHVLSNSFGFGGNCTSLVFSKKQFQ